MNNKFWILILLSLTLLGCNEEINWENLKEIYLFKKKPLDFETKKYNELIKLPDAKSLITDVVKKRLVNSKFKGKKSNCKWKGSSYYGITLFNDGKIIKLKMSSNYGIYQNMNTGKCYSIEGFETLGLMNWEELIKD